MRLKNIGFVLLCMGSATAVGAFGCSLANAPDEPNGETDGAGVTTTTTGAGGNASSNGSGGAGATGGSGGTAPACGNGKLEASEACDDDNTDAGDGCDAMCAVETGFDCSGEPSVCTTVCGDGIVAGAEACDDSNTDSNDGCDGMCAIETGYTCMGEPSACATVCGDGIVAGSEACDDNNTKAGDGCDAICAAIEMGYDCMGEPSICTPVCGDGVVIAPEQCDDKGVASGDGCSMTCETEVGWECMTPPNAPTACTRLFPAIHELSVGSPDYVAISNPHQVPIDLNGVRMMWNHTSDQESWALPSKVLMPAEVFIISEVANDPPGAFKPSGFSQSATNSNGGWVSICEGVCSSVNGANIKDLMQYEGTAAGPALPSGVQFSGGPVTGVDELDIQTHTVYKRVATAATAPTFLSSDWAWGCSSYDSCLVADSFENNTGGVGGWTNGPATGYSTKGQSTNPAHGTRSMWLSGGISNHTGSGFTKQLPQGSQPTRMQAWVRPGSTSANAYVILNGNTSGESTTRGIVWVYATSGNLIHSTANQSIILGQYTTNQWYRIDVENINWTAKTFDIQASVLSNGTVSALSKPVTVLFRDTKATEARRIMFYNFVNSSTRWDKVTLY